MLISLLVFIFLLPFILLITLGLISNFSNKPYEVIRNSDLPEDYKQEAITCLKKVRLKALKGLFYDATAPYVMLLVLPFVDRNAENLPSLFSNWDNEVSLNGDGWGKQLPDGNWVTIREPGDPDCIPYTHPDYKGDAYYAKGHHPRSFVARYIWLGWRNRASKLAYDQGVEISLKDRSSIITFGNPDLNENTNGWLIRKFKNIYEVYEIELKDKFIRRTRYGYKLGNVLNYNADKAMLATIGISYKKNK